MSQKMCKSRKRAASSQTVENNNAAEVSRPDVTGKIKSIYCENFVTYKKCTMLPGENLNIILGPNGTGKSTMVAAIVLGLGGEPKLLSRTQTLSDYIKNGEQCATIVVVLHANNRKVITFGRFFDRTNKSKFSINGETTAKNNFLSAIAEFNIQINNLCQFLPQDRVQDFAKMNPHEILLNTVKSVCTADMNEKFDKLRDLRVTQLNGNKDIGNDLRKLEESTTRLKELQIIMDRYRARNEIIEKLDICKNKKVWIEIKSLVEEITEVQFDLEQATKKNKENMVAYQKLRKQLNCNKNVKSRHEVSLREKESEVDQFHTTEKNIMRQIDDEKKLIQTTHINFETKKRELVEYQRDLDKESQMLDVISQDYNIAKAELETSEQQSAILEDLIEHIRNLKLDHNKQMSLRTNINNKISGELIPEIQSIKSQLERSKNAAEQKLQELRQTQPDVYQAVCWLRNNRQRFSGVIHDPMILVLNVSNPENAKYFENTIAYRDLLAFTCESKDDLSLLTEELCVKQKLRINVGCSQPAGRDYRPQRPIEDLKRFGFNAYMIDLVEGPPAVLNQLCALYKINNIPIGTDGVNRHAESIPTDFHTFFGGNYRYNCTQSKYANNRSITKSFIKPKNCMCSVDRNESQRLRNRLNNLLSTTDTLKNERTSIESKIEEIECKRNDLIKKKQALQKQKTSVENLDDRLKRQERKIATIKTHLFDVNEVEKDVIAAIQKHLKNLLSLHNQLAQTLKSYQAVRCDKRKLESKIFIFGIESESLINDTNTADGKRQQSQVMVDRIKCKLEMVQKRHKENYETALKISNNCLPNDPNFPNKEFYNELPNDLDDLIDCLNDYSARLECMHDVDPSVVSEYEARSKDIDMLKKSLDDNTKGAEDITAQIASLYNVWYPELERVVGTINSHFGKFMEMMGFVGEVVPIKDSDYDFDSYGIQIMVQYRKNVPLQALSRHRQSGGERAVAIAVYTMSMQHITHVPFRCVDEINQGMDAKNERKIIEMLVNETTKPGRAQYFFVTPKLLINLAFNSKVVVHFIYNGDAVQKNLFPAIC